ILPLALNGLCAPRVHNRTPDPPPAPTSPAPFLSSSRSLSIPSSPVAAGVHVWTSGSTPSSSTPGNAFPGTHQTTSDSPAASIDPPALRISTFPAPRTVWLEHRKTQRVERFLRVPAVLGLVYAYQENAVR